MMFDYNTYLSPYTWRYGSDAMRSVWSEAHKRRLWRKIWLALAEVQSGYGLISVEAVEDLRRHVDDIDVSRALEIEAEIHHDLMAELKAFAEQCPVGGGSLHLGATSMDIEDNADALRIRQALDLILDRVKDLLLDFCEHIESWAERPLIAFTHIQPAEPSTLGYRLSLYAQDLLHDWENLRRTRTHLRGKGFKGAVGTGASYGELLGVENLNAFEAQLAARLGLPFYPVTSQTYPRKQDYSVIAALAGVGASLYKFAFDLRILQSPPIGELSEPFGSRQVGSSAMPFKRNPIKAEKIDSLARLLAGMPRLAWDNASHSLLERTLDDSANRRTLLPEAFLITDEILSVASVVVQGLVLDETAMQHNLQQYGPFAASERVLMALGKHGADRQEMHERLRQHAMQAWRSVKDGDRNPLLALIRDDEVFNSYLDAEQLSNLLDVGAYTGDAADRARRLVATIHDALE
jgi:adenylosuccinate lyase